MNKPTSQSLDFGLTFGGRFSEQEIDAYFNNIFENNIDLPYVKYSKDMIFKVVKNQYNIDAEYKDIISILRLVRFFSEKEEGIG